MLVAEMGSSVLDPYADYLLGVSVSGAAIADAADLGVFGVARGGIFAAAGLGIARAAARLSIFGAQFRIFAFAAVHGGLGIFRVSAAARHIFGILTLAASHRGMGGVR